MAYQLLMRTSFSEYFPESVGGVRITSCHALITNLLREELSEEAAGILADPVVRERSNLIEWLTHLEGVPVELGMLSGADREAAADALCLRAGELAALGARLTGSRSEQRRLAGRLVSRLSMEAAAAAEATGGARRVFVISGRPVLAGWGMSVASADVGGEPLSRHELTEKERRAIDRILAGGRAVDPAPSGGRAGSARGLAPAPGPAPLQGYPPRPGWPSPRIPAAASGGGGFWRALLAALGAVLLLFFLAFLVFGDARRRLMAPPLALPDSGREDRLHRELRELRNLYGARMAVCRPAEPDREPERLQGIPEGVPPPPPPPEEEPVFVEGCWRSERGLAGTAAGKDILYSFCYSKEGKADVRVEVMDSTGNKRAFYCPASARAGTSGGKLTVDDTGAKCPADEPDFAETRVVCEPDGEKSLRCVVKSRDGEELPQKFIYLGEKR
ncbi:MAG: hypothetical protein LBQ79_14565 [Deltaproteobacteria bacterium]|jgi:hypothetical protein|nr:hypothetical protein [Deltaproteobacteria bacterium]